VLALLAQQAHLSLVVKVVEAAAQTMQVLVVEAVTADFPEVGEEVAVVERQQAVEVAMVRLVV
jgi:hypothetical protein